VSVLINPNNRSFGRLDHWQGRDLREFLTRECVPKLEARLAKSKLSEDSSTGIELNHSDNARWEFPIRYTLHKLDEAGATLMLGRDLRPIAEVQLQLAKAQMALERDHEAQREFDTRYRVLLNVTNDAIAFVSARSGRIVDLNKIAARLLDGGRDSLIGSPFAQSFDNGSSDMLLDALSQAVNGNPLDARIKRTKQSVRISPTVIRAAGERLLICRLDLNAKSTETESELANNLGAFFHSGTEAIIFTDRNGVIRSANECFLELIEAADLTTVKGTSLADYRASGAVYLRILPEHPPPVGSTRISGTPLGGPLYHHLPV